MTDVQPGSPAAEKGLQRGDVIVEADRKQVSDPEMVAEAVRDGRRAWRRGDPAAGQARRPGPLRRGPAGARLSGPPEATRRRGRRRCRRPLFAVSAAADPCPLDRQRRRDGAITAAVQGEEAGACAARAAASRAPKERGSAPSAASGWRRAARLRRAGAGRRTSSAPPAAHSPAAGRAGPAAATAGATEGERRQVTRAVRRPGRLHPRLRASSTPRRCTACSAASSRAPTASSRPSAARSTSTSAIASWRCSARRSRTATTRSGRPAPRSRSATRCRRSARRSAARSTSTSGSRAARWWRAAPAATPTANTP